LVDLATPNLVALSATVFSRDNADDTCPKMLQPENSFEGMRTPETQRQD
jgi:hypothetical protein